MKLYLMRHGEALSPQVDPERGLTENGKQKVTDVANYLKQKMLNFKHIIHSKKKRARETAHIMADVISPEITPKLHGYIAPEDDPNIIIAEINIWHEDTLIASHLPFVPNLLTELTGQDAYLTDITFETGTVICLEKDENDKWNISWSTCPSDVNFNKLL